MIHWGELLALVQLNKNAEATNAELKRVGDKLDSIHREQQREREERRRASLTPQQRAAEDRQKAEAEAKSRAFADEQLRQVAENQKKRKRNNILGFLIVLTGVGVALMYSTSDVAVFFGFFAAFIGVCGLIGDAIERLVGWGIRALRKKMA
jgi:Flp pilus assembly protein TadB